MANSDNLEIPLDRQADQGQDGDEALGDYLLLPPPDEDEPFVEDLGDGNIAISLGQPYEDPQEDGGFYDNLAEVIPDDILTKMATDLLNKAEEDKKDREEGDKLYAEGLQRTGMGKDAPGGADFEGASTIVHPMMTEACIDYEARIIKELWPVAGPVREKILGVPTKDKADRAKRKVEFMNYQLTTQIKEARAETESMLTQVPLGGAQYLKLWQDHRLKRPRIQFVARDNCYIPKNAGGWYAARRRTVREEVSREVLEERITSGMYRDLDVRQTAMEPDPSRAEAANRKIEGLSPSGINVDADREVYEIMSYMEISPEMADILQHEEEGNLYPYLITIEVESKQVLAVYRDWEMDDETYEPIDHIFEFPFVPWRGAYAIGLPQIIGGLSGAATGALRALLDSAMIANAQGGFILGGATSSQTKQPKFGEYQQIDGGGLSAPDIRARVMQFKSQEPSNVLFQLLGFIVEAGKGAVRTSLDEMNQEGNPNVPVGTQLSRVEEGLVVFSAIHGRVHEAFDRLLAGLHRLNRLYLPDEPLRVDAAGKEILVSREDFEGPPDVMPVSDPTIYSDQQRMGQMLALEQSATAFPQLFNLREIQVEKLKLWKIPSPERFLIPQQEPTELNAVNENVSLAFGKPVTVFPEQDHVAHIMTHLQFMSSPAFGMNPLIAPQFLGPALQHIAQHIVFQYAKWANDLVGATAGRQASELMSADPQVKGAFDKLLALASARVVPYATMQFQRIAPVIGQAMQMLKQFQPPTPVDPATVALQSAQAETARRGKNDQFQGALAAAKLKQDAADDAQRNAIAAERNQVTRDNAELAARTRIAQTALEGETAERLGEMRVETGQASHYTNGASLGG